MKGWGKSQGTTNSAVFLGGGSPLPPLQGLHSHLIKRNPIVYLVHRRRTERDQKAKLRLRIDLAREWRDGAVVKSSGCASRGP